MSLAVAPSRFLDQTHEVLNVSCELADHNMYTQDAALREAVQREGAAWARAHLTRFGQLTGSADYLELGPWPTGIRPSSIPMTAAVTALIWCASTLRTMR